MASPVERVLRPLVLSVVIGVFGIISSCMFAFRVLRAPRRSFKTLFGRSVDKRAVRAPALATRFAAAAFARFLTRVNARQCLSSCVIPSMAPTRSWT